MAQGKLNTLRGWLLWVACMALALWAGGAQAATPAANTVILNQSSMTYTDADGAAWSTTSNTVSTTVTQVYSYTLVSASGGTNNNRSVGPTVTAYSPYVLTNTGNGTDTFTVGVTGSISTTALYKIEIYEDDGTGNPTATAPLCSITTGTNASCTNATISLAAGAKYKFVVAYTVAGTATTGTVATSTVTAYSNTVAGTKPTLTDTITVNTTTSVFVTGLAIKTPTVAAPPGGSWPLVTTGRSTATNPVKTTYTLVYTNIGAVTGNVYIKNELPAGFSFVTGSAVSSCLSGTALNESGSNPSVLCAAAGSGGTGTAIDFRVSGQTLEVVVPNVGVGTSGSLSFQVQVSTTAWYGTSTTTNQASYSAGGCTGTSVSTCNNMTNTNAESFFVTLNRGVQLGLADTTAGTPASASDATQLAKLGVATTETMPFTVMNTGNATDTFNLSLSTTDKQATKNAYPSTAVFSWFADANATTPLQDTDGDGVLDTGSVNPFSNKTVYLRVYVPIDTPLNPQANYEATVLATSGNDKTIKDASYADVQAVHGGKIDLSFTATYNAATNVIGDWAPGPSASPVTTTAAVLPGATVTIPVYLTSNFDAATAISLTQGGTKEMGSLPSGWTAYWSTGACAGPTAPATVTSSTPNPGQTVPLNLCVVTSTKEFTVPQRVYLKAYTSTGTVASDILYVEVAVVTKRFVLQANRTNVVNKGSFVDYAHVATNTGAAACASSSGGYMKVEAAFADSSATTTGWSYALYLDRDNNDLVSSGDTIISDGKLTSGSLAVGASVKFLARVYAPLTPGLTTTVPLTVTVTDVDASGQASDCGSRSVTDLTTVQGSPLTVLKTQATSAGTCSASFSGVTFATTPLSVAAGDCLYYQIEVTNIGPGPQSNVVVSDVASNYTTFYSSGNNATCTGVSGFTGSSAVAVNGEVITCGAAGNSLPVGGKLTLRYAVQVKP